MHWARDGAEHNRIVHDVLRNQVRLWISSHTAATASGRIIRQAVWLYFRFALSYRDVEDMLAERGIDVAYETVCQALKFGSIIARKRGEPAQLFKVFYIANSGFTRRSREASGKRRQTVVPRPGLDVIVSVPA